jgi:hypothetical protein
MADNYYGIYRGSVLARNDPMNRGRLQVFVQSVISGGTWAEACQPHGSTSNLPPVGTTVWVMFEEGDPNYPVWMGCASDV